MIENLRKSKEERKVRNTLKSNKGITLIALVITIIVLLILAGVTIAMLSGENGILSRAQETNGTHAYYSAEEQVRLAYMAVKTEIMAKKASNGTYTAIGDADNLESIVKNELVKTGSGFAVSNPTENNTKIKIKYSNASLKAGGIEKEKPAQDGHVNYIITLSNKDAILGVDRPESEMASFEEDTGSSSDSDIENSSTSENFTFTVNGVEYTGFMNEDWYTWIERKGASLGFSVEGNVVQCGTKDLKYKGTVPRYAVFRGSFFT